MTGVYYYDIYPSLMIFENKGLIDSFSPDL
jgi:hypothetical protein